MPDPSPMGLQQSEALLREIRDELRTTRQVTTGQGSVAGRPSPAFIQAQQTTDRMVAGEWATMGWANAYKSPIQSSLANDMMGAMGLRAGPQSMWQREYENFSGSMLADRVGNFAPDLIMPGFGRRSRDMGSQMYQMSGRFNRSGDGRDTNIHSTMSMARDMQIGAATDMRLSGGDYNTIMKESANAGQFDFAGGLGDVKTQFNELRSAVADLTKTMRLGAGEVAQTMGAFRQFGITDVADQRRMAERLTATARVSGISVPEMSGIVRDGITGGMQFGLGASGSAALSENLVMAAREASRSGLVSGHIMAAGGNVQGIVAAQQNAINQFAGSNAGYYTALGSGAGNSLDDLMRGIGATGGTMGGIMAAESRKMDMMGGMGGGQRQRLFNRGINQQMQMLGVDPNSAEATDYAFSMVRGQMGDAAGLAYARQNFSAEGRKQRWQSSYRTQMELENQNAHRDYQLKMENESMFGQVRQMTGQLGAMVGGAGRGLSRGVSAAGREVGQWVGMRSGTFEQAMDQLSISGDDSLSAEAAIGAATEAERSRASGQSREGAIKLAGSVTTDQTLFGAGLQIGGGWGGGVLGGMAAMKMGAAAGSLLGPLGTVAGAAVGMGVGYMASGWIGGHAKATELGGDEAKNYMSAFRGSTGGISQRASNIANGNEAGVLEALSGKQAFKDLTSKAGRGKLSDVDSREMARLAGVAAHETGVSVEDVMGIARSMGVETEMQESYNSAIAGSKRYEKSMDSLLDGAESKGLSLASAEVASGVSDFAKAVNDNSDVGRNKARARLSAAGVSGRSLDNLMTGVDAMGEGKRAALVEDASSYVTSRGSAVSNRRFGAFNRMAENIASEAGSMNQAGGREAYERIQELKKDPQALMDVMMGKGDTKDNTLREFLIRQDGLDNGGDGMMGKLKELGSIDDLLSSSNDDRFSKATGLDSKMLQQLRTHAGAAGGSAAEQSSRIRQGAAMMMVGQSSAVKQASDPSNVAANNMLLAANILREIQGKISGDTSTKSAGGK